MNNIDIGTLLKKRTAQGVPKELTLRLQTSIEEKS
jgi:hypothetical protein